MASSTTHSLRSYAASSDVTWRRMNCCGFVPSLNQTSRRVAAIVGTTLGHSSVLKVLMYQEGQCLVE